MDLKDVVRHGGRRLEFWTFLLVCDYMQCAQAALTPGSVKLTAPITYSISNPHPSYTYKFQASGVTGVDLTCAASGATKYRVRKMGATGSYDDVKHWASWSSAPGANKYTIASFTENSLGKYVCEAGDSSTTSETSYAITLTFECTAASPDPCIDLTTHKDVNSECVGDPGKQYCQCKHEGVFPHCLSKLTPDSVKITGPNASLVANSRPNTYKFPTAGGTSVELTCAASGATMYRVRKMGATGPYDDVKHWAPWSSAPGANKYTIASFTEDSLGKYVCEAMDSLRWTRNETSPAITLALECTAGSPDPCTHKDGNSHCGGKPGGQYCQCKRPYGAGAYPHCYDCGFDTDCGYKTPKCSEQGAGPRTCVACLADHTGCNIFKPRCDTSGTVPKCKKCNEKEPCSGYNYWATPVCDVYSGMCQPKGSAETTNGTTDGGSAAKDQTESGDDSTAIIAAACVSGFLVLLAACLAACYYMRKKKANEEGLGANNAVANPDERENHNHQSETDDGKKKKKSGDDADDDGKMKTGDVDETEKGSAKVASGKSLESQVDGFQPNKARSMSQNSRVSSVESVV